MRERCQYCGESFSIGESVDIGIGFMKIFEDEPSCECEYIIWMEIQNNEVLGK